MRKPMTIIERQNNPLVLGQKYRAMSVDGFDGYSNRCVPCAFTVGSEGCMCAGPCGALQRYDNRAVYFVLEIEEQIDLPL